MRATPAILAAALCAAALACGCWDSDGTDVLVLASPAVEDDGRFGKSVAIADLNWDGIGDLIVGSPGADFQPWNVWDTGEVFVYLGLGGGRFDPVPAVTDPAPYPLTRLGECVIARDVTGDGLVDLVVGAPTAGPIVDLWLRETATDLSGKVFVFPGFGLGTFGAPTVLTASPPEPGALLGSSLAVADFTGDGRPDVAAGSIGATVGGLGQAGEVLVFPSDGAGSFGPPVIVTPPTPELWGKFGITLAAGDLTGDAVADLVVGSWGSAPLYVFPADGGGGFLPPIMPTAPDLDYAAAVADVTGDGLADLVAGASLSDPGGVADAGGILVFPAVGGGAFGPPTLVTETVPLAGASLDLLAVARADGDSFLDLVATSFGTDPGRILIFSGDGTGAFSVTRAIRSPDRVSSVAVGDATGDGIPDILAGDGDATVVGCRRAGLAYLFPGRP